MSIAYKVLLDLRLILGIPERLFEVVKVIFDLLQKPFLTSLDS